MIKKINPSLSIVDEERKPTKQLRDFFLDVFNESMLSGTGTPEGNVEAPKLSLYMDDTGTAGSILYVKQVGDVLGDRSKGWILI